MKDSTKCDIPEDPRLHQSRLDQGGLDLPGQNINEQNGAVLVNRMETGAHAFSHWRDLLLRSITTRTTTKQS